MPPAALAGRQGAGGGELQMPAEEFKRLDTFEANELSKADGSYSAGRYRQAAKEYEAFITQFPRSKAIPYALLRKARSLHNDEKRHEAAKAYEEVLDYFPNEITYASAALYYQGLAHWENADEQESMKSWAEMAEDADYSKHPLAGGAIVRLADYLASKDQGPKALGYYRQVVRDFRQKNSEAASDAIGKAIPFYFRAKNEGELRAFYKEAGTFGRFARVPDDLDQNWDYWKMVVDYVDRNAPGWFQAAERKRERDEFYAYWAKAVGERFADNDDVRLSVINWQRVYENDDNKWIERTDKQFADHQKAGNWDRIIRWMGVYAANKNKAIEYYQKLDFAKMDYAQIRRVMELLYDRIGEKTMARVVFDRIKLNQLTDAELASLAKYFWERDAKLVEVICGMIKDRDFGMMELLRFFALVQKVDEAVALADALQKSPTYAEEAIWIKAELLFSVKKFEESMMAFRQSNRQPDSLWRIADCYVGLKQLDQAISQLREVEGFFVKSAPTAAMKIAQIFRHAGKKDMFVAELRNIMKKYPESGASNEAHQILEEMNIGSGGGVDAK